MLCTPCNQTTREKTWRRKTQELNRDHHTVPLVVTIKAIAKLLYIVIYNCVCCIIVAGKNEFNHAKNFFSLHEGLQLKTPPAWGYYSI